MKNKGITLLALIVTVIIMLILATVTINLTNNGGAVDKAKEAVTATQKAADKEELQLAVFAATDYALGEMDGEALTTSLEEDGWTVVDNEDDTYTCTSASGNEFTVTIDGEISE